MSTGYDPHPTGILLAARLGAELDNRELSAAEYDLLWTEFYGETLGRWYPQSIYREQ